MGYLPEDKPIGSFLFLGPTGSGKTRLVEAVAESLVGNSRATIKIDCAEFAHSHEIAKLIGSPPGYLGHRETEAMLSQKNLDQYHTGVVKISFVLFDEIEKASDALWNLLLGILDKATLTLGAGKKVDFSHAMIFMTSNLGTKEIGSMLNPEIGFVVKTANDEKTESQAKTTERTRKCGIAAVTKKFSPEFINRIDKIAVFNTLGPKELRQILELELDFAQQRIFASSKPINLIFTAAAKELLLRRGFDKRYGARYLKRTVDQLVLLPLAELVEDINFSKSEIINLWVDFGLETNKLIFSDSQASYLKKANGT